MNDFTMQGLVICVSGPSGVGKGTIISNLLNKNPHMLHSVSVTTRLPRPGEKEGIDYYFRQPQEFELMLAEGEILEHDCYCGNYYGTPKAPLKKAMEQGTDIIMDVTVPGSLAVMKNFREAVTVFLLPPSFGELRRRLKHRGTESDAVLEMRLQKARDEIRMAQMFQYIVVNDDIDRTASCIMAIAEAERCRRDRMSGIENIILNR